MTIKTSLGTPKDLDLGHGIVEVRPITSRYFGVRVERRIIPKLKDVKGLTPPDWLENFWRNDVHGWHNFPA